ADETQELRAGARIAAEGPGHAARHHGDAAFVHAAGRHALVHRVHDHADTPWPQHLGDAVGDLRGEVLLHLDPPGVALHHAHQLADADDLVGGQVADVHPTDDGRHVMLAMRLEG